MKGPLQQGISQTEYYKGRTRGEGDGMHRGVVKPAGTARTQGIPAGPAGKPEAPSKTCEANERTCRAYKVKGEKFCVGHLRSYGQNVDSE